MTNRAGISVSVTSRPIVLDNYPPEAGDVKHGDNFKEDENIQNSITEMTGIRAIRPI